MCNNYPSDWDSRRKKVYKRDTYKCQNCGKDAGQNKNVEIHAHHIVPISSGGSHKTTNLITLCSDCHAAIHGCRMAPSSYSKDLLKDIQRLLLRLDVSTDIMLDINEEIKCNPYILRSSKEMQRTLLNRDVDVGTVKIISRVIEKENDY